MQTVFHMITDEFERTSGHKLVFAYATMGAITERGMAGETADLIVGSTQSLDRLAREGRLDPASRVTIAKVGIGAVVPAGLEPEQPDSRMFAPDDDHLARAMPQAHDAGAPVLAQRHMPRLGCPAPLRHRTRGGTRAGEEERFGA